MFPTMSYLFLAKFNYINQTLSLKRKIYLQKKCLILVQLQSSNLCWRSIDPAGKYWWRLPPWQHKQQAQIHDKKCHLIWP